MDMKGGKRGVVGGGGGMNWEIGIDIYTLMCIKWITNKNLLYKNKNKKYYGLSPDSVQTVSASYPWVNHLSTRLFLRQR